MAVIRIMRKKRNEAVAREAAAAATGGGDVKPATEATPLLTQPAKVALDDETSAVLRDRVTTSYTTIALVSALLAGVSFLAYATPPAQLFSAAGGSAAAAAIAPPAPQQGKHHEPSKSQWEQWGHAAVVFTYEALFDLYGVGARAWGERR